MLYGPPDIGRGVGAYVTDGKGKLKERHSGCDIWNGRGYINASKFNYSMERQTRSSEGNDEVLGVAVFQGRQGEEKRIRRLKGRLTIDQAASGPRFIHPIRAPADNLGGKQESKRGKIKEERKGMGVKGPFLKGPKQSGSR